MARIALGKAAVTVRSNKAGKCANFGKAHCLHKKKRASEKALKKTERCEGKDPDCKYFIGISRLVPAFDEKYLLPHKEAETLAFVLENGDNILMSGPPGCISGETILGISRGKRHHPRPYTIKEAYHKFNHIPFPVSWKSPSGMRKKENKFWNKNISTKILSLKDDLTTGYNEIDTIIYSGIKTTHTVKVSSGKHIRTTNDHRFRVPIGTPGADEEGFKKLKDLKIGDRVIIRSHIGKGKGRTERNENGSIYAHNTIFHPNAWKKSVRIKYPSGKLYKEYEYFYIQKSKAKIEAKINNLSLKEFLRIIREDETKAKNLKYLHKELQIYHKDRNPENNKMKNLLPVTKTKHNRIHSKKEHKKHLPHMRVAIRKIISIEEYGKEETFDIKMKGKYKNFAAHDFIIHNSGKTSLAKQLASILNWGLIQFSCSEETSSAKLLGQWIIAGKSMEWSDGYITTAMKKGYILLEDEADFMRPELRGELHSIMEDQGTVTLSAIHPTTKKPFQEVIRKHKNFRWVSTANTIGLGDDLFQYHGVQYFNSAARDRYAIILQFKYKQPDEEIKILTEKTEIDQTTAELMVRIANNCRENENKEIAFQFTLRRLLSWAKYWNQTNPEIASEVSVLNFCSETDRYYVKSLMRTHLNLEVD